MVAKLVSIHQVLINQHINKKIHCASTITLRKPRQRTTAASKPRPDAGRRKLNLRTPDHRRISRDRRSHHTFTSQRLLQQRLLHLYGVIASRGSCRTQRRSSCSPQRSSCCSSQCSSRCSSTLSQIMGHRRHLGGDPTLLFQERLSRTLPILCSLIPASHSRVPAGFGGSLPIPCSLVPACPSRVPADFGGSPTCDQIRGCRPLRKQSSRSPCSDWGVCQRAEIPCVRYTCLATWQPRGHIVFGVSRVRPSACVATILLPSLSLALF